MFDNKTAVITGGAKGIGEGCVRVFHREGASVAIVDVDEQAGTQLSTELGSRARFFYCDISDEDQTERAITDVIAHFESIHMLVNNAGRLHYATATEESSAGWDQIMNINLKGAFLCSKYTIPHMQSNNAGGVIVNMSSVQAFVTQENVAAYATSKAGLIGLTRSIAVDYAPDIRCVAICPGGVDTPLNQQAFQESADPEKARQETRNIHLVNRMASAEEVGEFVAFVCSDKGSFFNGQPLRIDGGIGLKIAGSKND